MRIAQVAPLYESVPPQAYGGTERVVSYLTEELVRRGHEVTLFASGDSRTEAELVACCSRSLRLDHGCRDQLAYHLVMLEQVCRRASEFDIIHFHVDYLHLPISVRQRYAHLTTLHGRLDFPEVEMVHRHYPSIPLVSISNDQRKPLPRANWQGTVYHGLPLDLYSFREHPDEYLLFLGRISREKRVDRAIEIATGAGLKLKIAAKVDKADQEYFDNEIKPLLENPLVEFIGEVGGKDKQDLMARALAFLFPIDWPEPFGLVMIESMACGTPVIAWPNGSVPEIMEDGVTGFIVTSIEEAVQAVRKMSGVSRAGCRKAFEQRFSAGRMAEDYLRIYNRVACTPGKQGPGFGMHGDGEAVRSMRLGDLPGASKKAWSHPWRDRQPLAGSP